MATTPREPGKVSAWIGGSLIGLVILALIVGIVVQFAPAIFNNLPSPTPPSKESTTPLHDPVECETWLTGPSDYTNNRWMGEGLASIRDAKTNEEATAAAYDWLEEVRKDPILLEATAENVLKRDVNPATLSSDGCATEAAVKLVTELQLIFASSKISPSDAPADGYNTGVENGTVVGSPTPGVNGDRTAIKIILPDGTVIWVMARCGNIVTPGPPPLPPGKTDCPPGDMNPDCAPKSDDAEDYIHSDGKPPVTMDGPADSAPTEVITEQPGGRGDTVIDTPTNPPGSETGVTAPGAEPPATDPPPPTEPQAPTPETAPTTCPIPPGKTTC